MKTISFKVAELPNIVLPLGIQGETAAREIRIDYSEWITEGASGYPAIIVLTPDGTQYVAGAQRGDHYEEDGSDTEIVWPITNLDTAEYGDGLIRLTLYGTQGEIVKSAECRTNLAPAFLKYSDELPDVYEDLADRIAEGVAAAGNAKTSATAAEKAAAAAEAYALAIKAGSTSEVMDGLMNLATTMSVTIELDDWEEVTESEDGLITLDEPYYKAVRENLIITADTAAILMLGEDSAEKCEACIEMDTGEGTITFKTTVLPTDDISGTVLLSGKFAVEPENCSAMTGATDTTDGATGTVPAPAAGDQAKYLQGDGTWDTPAARHGTGTRAVVEGHPYNAANGIASHAEGMSTIASGDYSHSEGVSEIGIDDIEFDEEERIYLTASGEGSHAEGRITTASGYCSHAEGNYSKASGRFSHAEGQDSEARGFASHSEGQWTGTFGDCSHVEGKSTLTTGDASHAEGDATTADGYGSHSEGSFTIASHRFQHVLGESNIIDPSTASSIERGTYVEIVGNGTYTARSNARTLDWSGNEWLAAGLRFTKPGSTYDASDSSTYVELNAATLVQLLALLS